MNNETNNKKFKSSRDNSDSIENIKPISSQDNLINDLKDSFTKTINSTEEIFENLIIAIEKTVNDEEIRKVSTQDVNNAYREFKESLDGIQDKISKNNLFEEE
tara:strand:- start:845 stop:1153 length:309 start_codon:yes stop_codon:yes gene_type:complete